MGKVTTGLLVGNLESKVANLMHQFPPTEVIYDPKRVGKIIINSLKNSIWQPNLYKQSSKKKKNMWSTVGIFHEVEGLISKHQSVLDQLNEVLTCFGDGRRTLSRSLGGFLNYLENSKLLDQFVQNLQVEFFDSDRMS